MIHCWWEPIHYVTGGKWIAYPLAVVIARRAALRAMRLVCVGVPMALAPVPAFVAPPMVDYPPVAAFWPPVAPGWGGYDDNMPFPSERGVAWGGLGGPGYGYSGQGAYGPVAANYGGVGYDVRAGAALRGGVVGSGVEPVDTVPVAEPSSLLVVALGFGSVVGFRRRK
jgi:hypothetical protein